MAEFFSYAVDKRLAPFWLPFGLRPGRDGVTITDAADPKQLARRLVLLYDGAVATAQMDKAPEAARTARRIAELVLDATGIRPRHHRPTRDSAQAPKRTRRPRNPRSLSERSNAQPPAQRDAAR